MVTGVGHGVPPRGLAPGLLSGVGDGVEQRVQTAELLFVDQPVFVDPGGECLELGRIQVHGSALGVPRPGDQPGLLEHLDVLRDRLLGDLEGIGQLVDRGRAPAESGRSIPAEPDRPGP